MLRSVRDKLIGDQTDRLNRLCRDPAFVPINGYLSLQNRAKVFTQTPQKFCAGYRLAGVRIKMAVDLRYRGHAICCRLKMGSAIADIG